MSKGLLVCNLRFLWEIFLFVACQSFPKGGLVLLTVAGFVELVAVLVVAPVVVHHLIDGAPVGEGAHVAVVDIHVGAHFPAWGGEGGGLLVGVVGIDGIELEAAPATIVDSLLQQVALTDGPQDEQMVLGLQFLQRGDGKGDLLADLRIVVLDDRPVEIDCDNHKS